MMSPSLLQRLKAARWYLVGALAGLAALVVWGLSTAGPTVALDLVAYLPRATQQRPSPEAFRVGDVTLAGETRRAIQADAPSRLIWEEVVPERGWLQVSLGVHDDVWTQEGAGVLFLVGVSQAGRYEELLSLIVNPYTHISDRQWLPVLLDLSPWAGQRVELIFNTRVAHADAPLTAHRALWGAPAIVTR